MLARILAFALLAVSLDLLVDTTGLPSLGHGAYFGAAAGAAGWIAIHVTPSGPVTLAAAAGVGAGVALVAGTAGTKPHATNPCYRRAHAARSPVAWWPAGVRRPRGRALVLVASVALGAAYGDHALRAMPFIGA